MSRTTQKLTELIILWLKGRGVDATVTFGYGCDFIVGAKYNITIWSLAIAYQGFDEYGDRVCIGDSMSMANFNPNDPDFFRKLAGRLEL